VFGEHVWVGTKVVCLKGTEISDNSVVGAASVVNNKFDETNVVIAGSPSKIVKHGVGWVRERIPM
jgi:acetyltransferase-like isoleucine patch superfamily enzyme